MVTTLPLIPAIGRWLAMLPELHHAEVIIIHGGNVARTEYGINLYHSGWAPELWHTGYDHGKDEIIEQIIERGGVPDKAFHYLTTTSTWSDGQQIAAMIKTRKIRSVLIVTDWWHSRRALCATKQQLQNTEVIIAFAPAPAQAGPENWWQDSTIRGQVSSELIKLMYYRVRYGMSPWDC